MILDMRGRRCPLPVIALARGITDVPVGSTVTVEADDPAAGPDLRAWCRMRGHTFVGQSTAADGTPRFDIRREN